MEHRGAWQRIESFVRVLAVPVLIVAILVVGAWLLASPLLTIPRFTLEGPVVRNGVAVIVACGEKRGVEQMGAAMDYAPEPQTGTWWTVRKGDCTVWYHNPPGIDQRLERSRGCEQPLSNLASSGEMLQTDRCFQGKQKAAILGELR